ncbi:hypothetical protein F4810DRAFT_89407 [Camillea tinctor]|nr:hypothetical protein F4810DRAFT_89407 [Camillea tinctor]
MAIHSRSPRTTESVVWRNKTRSTTAWELTSSVRFVWDKYQTILFHNFLRTVGLNYKNCDLTPLLIQLNLDGYETIKNRLDQNVHSIIIEKVHRKLNNTAATLDQSMLKAVSLGPNSTLQSKCVNTTKYAHDQSPLLSSSPVVGYQLDLPHHFPTPPNGQPSEPITHSFKTDSSKKPSMAQDHYDVQEKKETPASPYPLLKMPAKNPKSNNTQHVTIKREPESPPQHQRTVSKVVQTTEATSSHATKASGRGVAPVRIQESCATPVLLVPKATPRAEAKASASTSATGRSSNHAALQGLARRLAILTTTLRQAESAVGKVAVEDNDTEWGEVADSLSLGMHDVKIDVACLQELVEKRTSE